MSSCYWSRTRSRPTLCSIYYRYEQLLLEQDPLPSYALKLLLALIEQNGQFIRQIEKLGLTPVLFQVLLVSTVITLSVRLSFCLCVYYGPSFCDIRNQT